MTYFRVFRPSLYLAIACVAFGLFIFSVSSAQASEWVVKATTSGAEFTNGFNAVSFSDNLQGIAVSKNGEVFVTTNGNHSTWTKTVTLGSGLNTVSYIPSTLVAFAGAIDGRIYRTIDGGFTWNSVASASGKYISKIHFFNNSTGWLVDSDGVIYGTVDSANSWQKLLAPVGFVLYDLYFDGSLNGWAVGTDGITMYTKNGGNTWDMVITPTQNILFAVKGSGNTVYAAGRNSVLVSSFNGGLTWELINTLPAGFGPGSSIYELDLDSSGRVWVGINNENLAYTDDTGHTWTTSTLDPNFSVSGIASNSSTMTTIVGDNGKLYVRDVGVPNPATNVSIAPDGNSTTNKQPTVSWSAASDPETSIDHYSVVVDGGNVISVGKNLSYLIPSQLALGNHSVIVIAVDEIGSSSNSDTYNFTIVAEDITPPVVSAVSPTSVTKDVATSIKVSATDDNIINSCSLVVDGVTIGAMTYDPAILKWTRTTTFLSSKTYQVSAKCTDNFSNIGTGLTSTITVSTQADIDSTNPVVSNVQPSAVTLGSTQTITATVSDNVGVTSCYLYAGGLAKGQMTKNGSVVSKSYNFSAMDTDYSVVIQVQCNDAAGNVGIGARTVDVSKISGVGGTVPSVNHSSITASPSSVQADNVASIVLTINVKNDLNQVLSGKTVQLITTRSSDDVITIVSSKTNTNGQATFYIKSKKAGLSGLYAVVDGMTVADKALYFVGVGEVTYPGSLIKLECPDGAEVNHPCKAVYFHGGDGKRHAFPNSKVYFSWYSDFNSVQTVTPATMSSLSLGKNITYRPGVRMVKFQTVNTVYAVSKGGVLRAIPDEATAKSMYGSNWNQQIDDISDAFFSHYTFGTQISNSNTFNKVLEKGNVITLLQNGV